jgi:regulator of sigma E protease
MTSLLLQVIIGVLVLGILVFLHELGHFIAAKSFGIRVLAFSIGFGKPVLKITRGGTEYRFSMIPVGGYVHMAGEHPEDETAAAPDEFPSKPVWQRAVVVVAGPVANIISAAFILWVVFISGVNQEIYLDRPVVGAVADSSAARTAGFAAGDSIITINGHKVASWNDIEKHFTRQELDYQVTYSRDGQENTTLISVPAIKGYGIPDNPHGGLQPSLPAIIGIVTEGGPADEAGLEAGDVILTANDKTIHSWFELSGIVALYDSSAGPLAIGVLRADSSFNILTTPRFNKEMNRSLLGIQVGIPPARTVRYNPFQAFVKAMEKTWEYTAMIFNVIEKLASRKVSAKQLAGPIGIVQMSGMAALSGFSSILTFMALIGVNLAVINLFPLVITDGGVLLFLIIEAIRGRPLSRKKQEMINRAAIAFFLMLFLFVTFNDIQRFPFLMRLIGR